MIIGISGAARSGKNLFASLLQAKLLKTKNQKSEIVAIAAALKEEVREFLLQNFNLDSFSESTEDKNKFRDLLVWYANLKRSNSDGQYWIEKINNKVEENKKNGIITLLSDVRFAEKDKDELYWIKNVWRGKLVYVELNKEEANGNKFIVPPANEHEERNNKILKRNADYLLSWDFVDSDFQKLDKHINFFIDWLDDAPLIT